MRTWTAAATTLVALTVLTGSAAGTGPSDARSAPGTASNRSAPLGPLPAVTYQAPLAGRVLIVAGFQPPPTPYAAGHRGVDLATVNDQVVRAAAAGVVTFAGSVAGRGVVVIAHADGVRTEYEPVTPTVPSGRSVAAGQPIGRVRGVHRSCSPGRCLHWGASRDGVYFDPLSLLLPLGPVRLMPWGGG
jgi:murein DD-endopeptidase MepM/ murein hydrolase activator NlpD